MKCPKCSGKLRLMSDGYYRNEIETPMSVTCLNCGFYAEKEQEAAIAQNKAETMYKMIMPLLNNLKKNPEKPNIVWPDREKKINDFIKKLDSVLNQ